MSSVYQLIRDAVLNKRIVLATYRQHERMMCPHVLGRARDGAEQGLFYQFAGTSDSGLGPPESPENWRCIPIAGLSEVSILDGDWHTCSRHTRQQTCVKIVDVEVAY